MIMIYSTDWWTWHYISGNIIRKTARRKQAPVPMMQALDESLSLDLQDGSQAKDYNGLCDDEHAGGYLKPHTSHRRRDAWDEGRYSSHTCREPITTCADHGRDQTQARHQPSPQEPDFSEAVSEKVARWLKQLFIVVASTMDQEFSNLTEKEQPAPRRKRTTNPIIKSCKVHTADSIVSKCIIWLHEVVYSVICSCQVCSVWQDFHAPVCTRLPHHGGGRKGGIQGKYGNSSEGPYRRYRTLWFGQGQGIPCLMEKSTGAEQSNLGEWGGQVVL